MQGSDEQKTTEIGSIGEKVLVAFDFVLVLVGYGLLNLVVFCSYPGIVLVTSRMELGEGSQTFLRVTVIDKPTGRFWKEQDKDR